MIIRSMSRRDATPTRARILEMRSGLFSLSIVAGAGGSLRAGLPVVSGAALGPAALLPKPGFAEKPPLPPALPSDFASALGLVSRTKVLPSPRFGLSLDT